MDSSLILARLEKFEGRVPYMYRCTGGEVTVGIGHAIQAADDALRLPWKIAGRPATPGEVRADYTRIEGQPKGLLASRYEALSLCRVSNDAIDSLAAADVQLFVARIAASLPNWNTFPACVQAAIFD